MSERSTDLLDALIDVNWVVVVALESLCYLEQVLMSSTEAVNSTFQVEVF